MFWIFVAVLIIVALAIVIIPLLKTEDIDEVSREEQNIAIAKDKLSTLNKQLENKEINDEQFVTAKVDLENALALDLADQQSNELHQGGRWLLILLVIAIPLASTLIYFKIGSPDLLDPQEKLAQLKKESINLENMSVVEMIELVKERLTKNPEDGEGWYVLGRTFMNIQKYKEAVTAYKRSYELVGEQPNIMLSLADALAMTNEGSMIGEPEKLVQKAISIEPNNEIGLWLAGLSAEQRNDVPAAYQYWSRLLPLLSDEPASYNEIKQMLSELKTTFPELLADLPTIAEPAAVANTALAAALEVKLFISLDADIRKQLNGNEQVFVYAKAVTGPPMPLAAKKLSVADLPVQITLSDADAMMPQLKLSTVDAFTVGARVSLSGNPIPQKGDFYIEVSPLNKDSVSEVINLTIQKLVD